MDSVPLRGAAQGWKLLSIVRKYNDTKILGNLWAIACRTNPASNYSHSIISGLVKSLKLLRLQVRHYAHTVSNTVKTLSFWKITFYFQWVAVCTVWTVWSMWPGIPACGKRIKITIFLIQTQISAIVFHHSAFELWFFISSNFCHSDDVNTQEQFKHFALPGATFAPSIGRWRWNWVKQKALPSESEQDHLVSNKTE